MSDFTRGIKVYLDSQGYGKGIDEMVAKSEKFRKKLAELEAAGKGKGKQADNLRKKLLNLQKAEDEYNAKLQETERILNNLSGATYNELYAVRNKLRNQLRDTKRDTEEYRQLLATLTQTEKELKKAQQETTVEIGCQGTAIGKVANWFNRYLGLISSGIAALTGITMTARKCRTAFNEQAEAEADVMKYTGLTREEVSELNLELGRMDTRTSRLALNALAADAGKLGLKGKQDLLDFAGAGDVINLSLGEDLGEGAVKNIGKLAMMFGEDDRLGLRGAMISTASAVNEVAQSSTSAEPYIVNFTARVGGVATQAKIAQADIMGYASVLDQNMQKEEMAATAFQTLISQMFYTPQKFARMLNVQVSEFTDLMKNDANEAVLMFLENMNARGGFQELMPIFKNLGMDGQRAIGVLSTMAGKIGDIREAQRIANEAYREGTSAIEEAQKKNATPEAQAEKARKVLQDLMVDLGEKLTPLLSKVYSSTSMLVRVLSTLVTFTIKYRTAISSAIAMLTAYAIRQTIVTNNNKLLLFWNEKVLVSFKNIGKFLKQNWVGIAITAVAALVGYLVDLKRKTDELAKSEDALSKIRKDAARDVKTEETRVRALLAAANDETRSKTQRLEAIRMLKDISPQYLGTIDLETIKTEQATRAVNNYIESLRIEHELKQAIEKKSEKEAEVDELMEQSLNPDKWSWDYIWRRLQQGQIFSAEAGEQVLSEMRLSVKGQVDAVKGEISELDRFISERQKRLIELQTADGNVDADIVNDTSTPSSLERMKQELQEQLNAKAVHYAKEKNLLRERMADGEISQDEYNMLLQKLEMEHADARMLIHQDYYNRLQGYTFDSEDERRKTLFDAQKSIEADEQASEEARLAMYAQYYANLEKIKKAGAKADTDEASRLEAEKQAELKVLEAYYKASLQYAEQHGMDTVELTEAYNTAKENITEKYEQRKTKTEDQEERKRQKMLNQYAVESASERYRRELEELKEAKAKQLITEEEYEKAKRSMQLDYWSSQYQTYQDMAASAVEAVQQAEIDRVEAKYEALIAAAEGNDAEQERLENEKAQAKLDIEKKYADVNFGIKVSQIIADTAVAIMRAYADLGPVGGSVAAALLGVTGAAQLVSAKAERDKVKSMTLDGGSSSGSVSTAERVVQYADGKYDVIGLDDGKPYHVPYIGSVTGIVDRPALISENGAELIVNAEDLRRLQRHVDYPVVVGAINDARMGYVPQHSEGSYKRIDDNRPIVSGGSSSDETVALLREVLVLLRMLPTQIRAYVLQSDLNKAEELKNKSESPFTRGDKNHGTTH